MRGNIVVKARIIWKDGNQTEITIQRLAQIDEWLKNIRNVKEIHFLDE